MSWDLLAYRETAEENGNVTQHALGEWSQLKALVSSQLNVEWEGPFWASLPGDGYSIEINVGGMDSKEGDAVNDISFNVRGGGNPLPVIVDFCKRNSLSLHDLATGTAIDLDNPSSEGFEAFQTHRDAAVERARERHGGFVETPAPEPSTKAQAQERADRSGYLRDQPFAHMEYTKDKFCNNFVAWTEELLFTGAVEEDVAESLRAELGAKGFYRIPDQVVRSPGPPIWFKNITRIEVEQDRPSIRVHGRDPKGVRSNYSIRFADDDRKQAFLETLLGHIDREHRKEEGVSPGLLGVAVVPFVLAAIVSAVGYGLFPASVAKWIAIVMAALFAIVMLGAVFGKPMKADHYVFADEDPPETAH